MRRPYPPEVQREKIKRQTCRQLGIPYVPSKNIDALLLLAEKQLESAVGDNSLAEN